MKFIVTLIVIIGIFFGGVVLYNKYFKKETATAKPIPEQVVADETKAKTATKSVVSNTNDSMKLKTRAKSTQTDTSMKLKTKSDTLITADTPIKHSRWGKKIDSIYKKHNAALEKAAGDDK